MSDPIGDEALQREMERLTRHVNASNARAKTAEPKPAQESAPAPEPNADLVCAVCHMKGEGKRGGFCLVETRKNPKTPIHVKCFACIDCGKSCLGCDFQEDRDGRFYCDKCTIPEADRAIPTFSATCARCGKGMDEYDDRINAMGKVFHKTCFVCYKCGGKIEGSVFGGPNEELYCSEDCARKAAAEAAPSAPAGGEEGPEPDTSKCAVCGKEFTESYMMFNGQAIHPDCFKCSKCGAQLGDQVYLVDNKPTCEKCATQ